MDASFKSTRENSKKSPRRRIGRPQATGDTVGREALIAATKELLKRVPPAKITRRKVAQFAGVTPALVRYYFGNTDELLRATTIILSQEQRAKSRARVAEATAAKEKLLARITVLTETLISNPYFNQLVIEQIIHGEGNVAKRALEQMNKDSLSELKGVLDEGVSRKELRQVEVKFFYFALIGMIEFFASNRPMRESVFGRRKINRTLVQEYIAFVYDLILNGIAAAKV